MRMGARMYCRFDNTERKKVIRQELKNSQTKKHREHRGHGGKTLSRPPPLWGGERMLNRQAPWEIYKYKTTTIQVDY